MKLARPRRTHLYAGLALLAVLALVSACSPGAPAGEPPFALRPARTTVALEPGGAVSSFVGLERSAGFTGSVRMTFQDLPPGFSQTWSRDSPNGDCSLLLSADDSVRPGTYTLKLVGQIENPLGAAGVGAQNQATLSVQRDVRVLISPARPAGFNLSLDTNIVTVNQGSGETGFVNVRYHSDFAESVQLDILNRQPPVLSNFLPDTLQKSNPDEDADASELFLVVPGGTPPGQYNLTVGASAPSLSRTADLLVVVPER